MIIVQDFSRSPVAREQRSPELWGPLAPLGSYGSVKLRQATSFEQIETNLDLAERHNQTINYLGHCSLNVSILLDPANRHLKSCQKRA